MPSLHPVLRKAFSREPKGSGKETCARARMRAHAVTSKETNHQSVLHVTCKERECPRPKVTYTICKAQHDRGLQVFLQITGNRATCSVPTFHYSPLTSFFGYTLLIMRGLAAKFQECEARQEFRVYAS